MLRLSPQPAEPGADARERVLVLCEDGAARDHATHFCRQLSERCARVVECRYFAGLTEEETAAALDVSVRTAQREWFKARAWLRTELAGLSTRQGSGQS